jgi:hypothetical protein
MPYLLAEGSTVMNDRELRIRVYRNGVIVVMVFAPATLGERCISHGSFISGWHSILQLIARVQDGWEGLQYEIKVRHQGLLLEE